MKSLILLVFSSLTIFSFGQLVPKHEVEEFWNSNMLPIIKLDKATIENQTNFPLEGSWGYIVDDLGDPESWTKELYVENLGQIYSDAIRIAIRSKSINDLAHMTTESGETALLLSVYVETKDKESDIVYETSYMFFFKKFEGVWKLYKIELAG